MKTKKITTLILSFLVTTNIFSQNIGIEFYKNLTDLPYLYSNVESHYISSYDRTGGNDDGFRGTYSQLYIDKNGERVIFEGNGPGCIYHIWGTGPNKIPNWGTLKFYFDDEKEPRLEIDSNDFFSGLTKPFVFPLINHQYTSSGGFSSSVPFPFAKSLKITTEKKVYFYNIYYQLYKDVNVQSWSSNINYDKLINIFQRSGSDLKSETPKNISRRTIVLNKKTRPDKIESAELFSFNQAGTIQSIKINPLYKPDIFNLNHIYIKIYFDEQSEPSVNVPIGPFFGSGLGEADVRSLFIGMSSSTSYYCYLPMPFKKSVKIELENLGYDSSGKFFTEIDYSEDYPKEKKNAQIGYFGAKYNKKWPADGDKDYQLFNYEGKGAVVGQVMVVEPVKPDLKQWWEGDMRIYIDDEKSPRFHGTGHEDEYQGGWSNFWLSNPYSLPLFGMPKSTNLINISGQLNGSVTAYRFWPGTIPFKQSIKISTEHGTENKKIANYSSVVFYYFLPNSN